MSAWIALPLIAAPLAYLAIEIALCGSLGQFIDTYRIYASFQRTLGYTVHFEKGPYFRYLLDFFAIAPIAFIAAIIGFAVVPDAAIRDGRNLGLIYFISGALLFNLMPMVNVRLVLFLDIFLRLGTAIAIAYLAAQFGEKWTRRLVYSCPVIVCLTDVLQFYSVFVVGNVYSPTTYVLLRAEGFYDTP